MGKWSFGLSVAVSVAFLALLPLARAFAVAEANEPTSGMYAPGAALLSSIAGLALILLDLVALGLGVAGIVWEPPPPVRPPGFPTEPAGEVEG